MPKEESQGDAILNQQRLYVDLQEWHPPNPKPDAEWDFGWTITDPFG